MPTLVWDQIGDRVWEAGVSKGVLYVENNRGIAWNGLTTVEEDSVNESEEFHFDGVKYADIVTVGDFKGTIRAITYPDEFMEFEGSPEEQTGFHIMNQPPKQFSMAYRTQIGDDLAGIDSGYKLHILWNLTAIPATRTYQSLGSNVDPTEFEWQVTSIPEPIQGYQPTAHIVLNSRKLDPAMLQDIEDILYGDDEESAYLPSLQSLATFIRKWDRLIIVDNGDGTWTATSNSEGIIEMLDAVTFQITSDTAEFIDPDTYTISSSEKNEEDIWLP